MLFWTYFMDVYMSVWVLTENLISCITLRKHILNYFRPTSFIYLILLNLTLHSLKIFHLYATLGSSTDISGQPVSLDTALVAELVPSTWLYSSTIEIMSYFIHSGYSYSTSSSPLLLRGSSSRLQQ